MSILDLAAFDATPLQRDPFDFLIVPRFIPPDMVETINRDFPAIQGPGNYSLSDLTYGGAFEDFLGELNGPEVARRFGDKFGVDLMGSPTTITVRGYSESSDGNIHTDHWSKVVTVLVYFNMNWGEDEGRLRLLRSAKDIEDYAIEVPPVAGTLLAFRRSKKSFHGHKRCEGERRMLQMSWLNASRTAQYAQELSRFSTRTMKRVQRLVASAT